MLFLIMHKILGMLTLIELGYFCGLALLQGKDMATGGFSKLLGDVDAQESVANSTQMDFDTDLEELSKRKQVDYSSAMSTQSRSPKKKKRSCATVKEDTIYKDLSSQIGKVAVALKKIYQNQLNMSYDGKRV